MSIANTPAITELWPYINQIEEVLHVMNAGFVEFFEDCGDLPERGRSAGSSLHNLLGAAQTITESLARAALVR